MEKRKKKHKESIKGSLMKQMLHFFLSLNQILKGLGFKIFTELG